MPVKSFEQTKAENVDAFNTAKLNSDDQCTLNLEGCENDNSYVYQKEIIIIRGQYVSDNLTQTPDNFIFCCQNCYLWVMYNREEATALGLLNW